MKLRTIRYSPFARLRTGGCRAARTDPWRPVAAAGIAAAGSIVRRRIAARVAAARIAAAARRVAAAPGDPADHRPRRAGGRPAPPCGAAVSPWPVSQGLLAVVR